MAIGTGYRLFFEDEAEDGQRPGVLEITGGGKDDDARVWLSTPPDRGVPDFIVGMSRQEARELTAILRVLFEEATEEDDALVGVSREATTS